jgi:glycosyltransferase involved in cell wall biosynthesis
MYIIILVTIVIFLWFRHRVIHEKAPQRLSLVHSSLGKGRRHMTDNKLVWIMWEYLPDHTTQHTRYMHTFVKHFVHTFGWNVTIVTPKSSVKSYEDIPILEFKDRLTIERVVLAARCIVAEDGVADAAVATAAAARLPLVLFIFNEHLHLLETGVPIRLVVSSQWLVEKYPDRMSIVVRKPIFSKQAITYTSREYIGYIDEIGQADFRSIQVQLPGFPFLHVDNTIQIKSVLEKIGILCILTDDEMNVPIAMEAAYSGIPIICYEHRGIREVLGDSVIFVTGPKQCASILATLKENMYYYERLSRAISKQARAYETMGDLERLRSLLASF